MLAMKISKNSAWNEQEISDYLSDAVIPIRLAVTQDDFPLLCSVWFTFDADRQIMKCASHQSSALIKALEKQPKCSFEIAPNEPPYRGVRGSGSVTLTRNSAEATLNTLISKYLATVSSPLADWLLSRAAEEFVIEITPAWITAWDYSHRMTKT